MDELDDLTSLRMRDPLEEERRRMERYPQSIGFLLGAGSTVPTRRRAGRFALGAELGAEAIA